MLQSAKSDRETMHPDANDFANFYREINLLLAPNNNR
jgi:hypothetical protein